MSTQDNTPENQNADGVILQQIAGTERPEIVKCEKTVKREINLNVATTGRDGTSRISPTPIPMVSVNNSQRLR